MIGVLLRTSCPGVLLAGTLLAGSAAARQAGDSGVVRLEEPLVVSVSARPVPAGESASAVLVISSEDIRNSHADSLGDLLSTSPLIHVSRAGHGGSLTTATIRGGDPNFTLVLIDGIPMNDPTNILGGSYDLSTISLDNVERVEIVRGPMSSIHGSAASAGVINVITRRSRESSGLALEGMIGNPSGTGRFRLSGGGRAGATTFSLGASILSREGFGEGVDSSLGVVSAAAETAMSTTRSLDWLVRYQRAESDVFPENGGGPEHAILGTLKNSLASETVAGIGYTGEIHPDWALRLSWNILDSDRTTDTPPILDAQPPSFASLPAIASETGFTRNRFGAASTWTLAPAWTAHLGLGVDEERGTSDSTIAGALPADFELERTTLAVTGEVAYAPDRLNLNLNLRVDRIDGFGVEMSPGVGVLVPVPGIPAQLRASWARAFKAPSFYAIGDPLIGNAALEPERTRGFDIGIENVRLPFGTGTSFSLTYFRNRFEDLIDFSPALFQLVNRSRAYTQGVETTLRVEVSPRATITGNAAYLDWSLEGTGEPLRDRPRWRGGAGLRFEPFSNAHLRWDTVWVGPRFDFQVPVPTREQAGGYSTTDVSFTLERDAFEVFARAENLFDRHYHEFIGFPDAGFRLRVGASFEVFE